MPRWKRNGVLVVQFKYDHPPRHVHVYEDGLPTVKFNIEAWCVMTATLTVRAKKVLEQLKKEGVL